MRRVLLSTIAALAAAVLPAAAQDFLPGAFNSWSSSGPVVKVRAETLEQFAGADAGVLREYGATSAENRSYSRGGSVLMVTLYVLRDPSGAFGAFTYLRSEAMSPSDVALHAAVSKDRALVVVGNFLIHASGSDLVKVAPDLKALTASLAPRADKTPFPTISQHLPVRGLVPRSERYLLGPMALQHFVPLGNGDWLGFADGAEATLGRYRIEGQEATLLLAAYPTPQAAVRKLEELGHWFHLNPDHDTEAGSPTPIFARRQGSLLTLVTFNKSRAVANSLLDRVHYATQVTWNEPSHKLTDPSISSIVVGAIVGTGVILFFALIAGIGFGGLRLIIKYFLPGKVFDRESQVGIIQLGLSSKPIEAKDFY